MVLAGSLDEEGPALGDDFVAVEVGRRSSPAAPVDAGDPLDIRQLAGLHSGLLLHIPERDRFESIRQVAAFRHASGLPALVVLLSHLYAAFDIGEKVVGDLGKLNFGDNLQVVVPDGVAELVKGVRPDLVGDSTDYQVQAVESVFKLARAIQQHPDDFRALAQVDLSVLTLRATHRGRVDLKALGDQLSDLLGEDAMERLRRAKVIVFGAGGVGGAVIEALARGGVGEIHVVDPDCLSVSNINRQILATEDTVGVNKAEAAVERIRKINPDCVAVPHKHFYLRDDKGGIVLSDFDYVVDAIDTVSAKLALIEEATESGVEIICSMGTGNKLDPTQFEITDIYKTSGCPLARVMRTELKKRGIKKLKVLYSKEQPLNPVTPEFNEKGKSIPGSVSFVPSVAGYIIGGEVIKDLINKYPPA